MRISYSMIYDQTEFNINKQYDGFYDLNEKVTTGKEVNRPSDDPIAMSNILGYRSTISSLEQYETNIERGNTWLRYTESSLDQAKQLVESARTLAVQMANEPNEAQMEIIAPQVRQIAEQLLQLANTSVSGKFLFSGHKTETLPFTMDEDLNVTYHGDNNKIKYSISETADVTVNATGYESFMEGNNAFDVLKKFHKALTSGDALEVGCRQKYLAIIGEQFRQLLQYGYGVLEVLDHLQRNDLAKLSPRRNQILEPAVVNVETPAPSMLGFIR